MSQQPHEDQSGPSLIKPGETTASAPPAGPQYGSPQPAAPQQGIPHQQAPHGYGQQPAQAFPQQAAPGFSQPPAHQAPPQQGYGQTAPGHPFGGQPNQAYPPVGYGAPGQVSQADEKTWSIIAHAGPPVVAILSGGMLAWIPPLVSYLMYKDKSPFVRQHSTEALNFQITLLIAYVVCLVLAIITLGIGAVLYVVPWILSIIFAIMGAMAANEGRAYRYPMNLRLVS